MNVLQLRMVLMVLLVLISGRVVLVLLCLLNV